MGADHAISEDPIRCRNPDLIRQSVSDRACPRSAAIGLILLKNSLERERVVAMLEAKALERRSRNDGTIGLADTSGCSTHSISMITFHPITCFAGLIGFSTSAICADTLRRSTATPVDLRSIPS
jgi:hypothetical protein